MVYCLYYGLFVVKKKQAFIFIMQVGFFLEFLFAKFFKIIF